jgi:hypothetical protein
MHSSTPVSSEYVPMGHGLHWKNVVVSSGFHSMSTG